MAGELVDLLARMFEPPSLASMLMVRDGVTASPLRFDLAAFTTALARALRLTGPIKTFRRPNEPLPFFNLGRDEEAPVFFAPRISSPQSLLSLLNALSRPGIPLWLLVPTWAAVDGLRELAHAHTPSDLVSIGTLADIISIDEVGRILAHPLPPKVFHPPDTPDHPGPEPPTPPLPPPEPVCVLHSTSHAPSPLTEPEALNFLHDIGGFDLVLDTQGLQDRGPTAWVRQGDTVTEVALQPSSAKILACLMLARVPLSPWEIPGTAHKNGIKQIEFARRRIDDRPGGRWRWVQTISKRLRCERRYCFIAPEGARWALLVEPSTSP